MATPEVRHTFPGLRGRVPHWQPGVQGRRELRPYLCRAGLNARSTGGLTELVLGSLTGDVGLPVTLLMIFPVFRFPIETANYSIVFLYVSFAALVGWSQCMMYATNALDWPKHMVTVTCEI